MLNELFQYKDLDEKSKNRFLKLQKNTEDDWRNNRYTLLERKLSNYNVVDLDWDLTQYLSENADGSRGMLKSLIHARACYQDILKLIQGRNFIYDKIFQNPKFATGSDVKNEYISKNKEDLDISEKILLLELKSVTDLYFDRFDDAVKSCYEAFNMMSKYINKKFPGYAPLELEVPKDKMEILEKMNKDKTVHAAM